MKKVTQYKIFTFVIFIILFFLIWAFFNHFFESLNEAFRAILTGGITALLAPRVQNVKTATGEEHQLRWIFLKKPITI
ncbi:hypothetical protein [Formosa haliotis]|uniref:hypothetical protein n=1 Tax=Formosa haliotis TaxID=1555194 RepID=UPI000826FACD|nr:hypothetical protein [Formosa haliotis]